MATMENLKDAFASESQTHCKYLAFARKADEDGYPEVAKLFRAAAAGEAVHAIVDLRAIGEVRSTAENLQEATSGESIESRDVYPRYEAMAMQEDNVTAVESFQNAMAAEQVHQSLCLAALRHIKGGQDLPPRRMYVCGECGDLAVDEPPQTCPVCSTPGNHFEEVQ